MPRHPNHVFTDEERGRPTSPEGKAINELSAQTHGFYVSANFLCCKACEFKKACQGRGDFKDFMGIERCIYEEQLYIGFMKQIEAELEDEPLKLIHLATANILLADYLTFCRAHRYLTKEGLVMKFKIKDDKSGEIKEILAQNILKKDMYYQKRSILEFLSSLKLSRASRDPATQKFDLAMKFQSE